MNDGTVALATDERDFGGDESMIGVSLLALISSIAALLAPLLSMVTFSGTSLACMALSKKRMAAATPCVSR